MKYYLYLFLFFLIFFFNFNFFLSYDKLEFVNRRIYAFNRGLDEIFLNRFSNTYISIIPNFLKSRISDFFNNLFDFENLLFSFCFCNYIDFYNNFSRVLVNSTFGFIGFFNFADYFNFKYKSIFFSSKFSFFYKFCDFKRYIVLPFIGPGTISNNFFLLFLNTFNPFFYLINNLYVFYFFYILNKKNFFYFDVNFFNNTVFDSYLFLKDVYFQHFYIF